MTTKGEYRIKSAYHPNPGPIIDVIKDKAAELIDLIETIDSEAQMERTRLKALAQTAVEEAAMWAVKAATKVAPPADFVSDRQQPSTAAPGGATDPFVDAVRHAVVSVMGSLNPPKIIGQAEYLHILSQIQKRGFLGVAQADVDIVLRTLRKLEAPK